MSVSPDQISFFHFMNVYDKSWFILINLSLKYLFSIIKARHKKRKHCIEFAINMVANQGFEPRTQGL